MLARACCVLGMAFFSAWGQTQGLSPLAENACEKAGIFSRAELHRADRKAYRLAQKRPELFAFWQIAESVSISPLYGQNRNRVVLQLVCMGNAPIVEKNAAILDRYQVWAEDRRSKFNLCQFAASGEGLHFCALRRARIDNQAYLNDLQRLINPLPSRYRKQAMQAYASALRFFTLKAELEELHSGSGFAAWRITSIQAHKKGYLARLKQIKRREILPPLRSWSEVNRELDRLYRQLQVKLKLAPIVTPQTEITLSGVERVHKVWLIYRQDNAILFQRLDRRLSIRQWEVLLTEQRIKELKHLLAYRE